MGKGIIVSGRTAVLCVMLSAVVIGAVCVVSACIWGREPETVWICAVSAVLLVAAVIAAIHGMWRSVFTAVAGAAVLLLTMMMLCCVLGAEFSHGLRPGQIWARLPERQSIMRWDVFVSWLGMAFLTIACLCAVAWNEWEKMKKGVRCRLFGIRDVLRAMVCAALVEVYAQTWHGWTNWDITLCTFIVVVVCVWLFGRAGGTWWLVLYTAAVVWMLAGEMAWTLIVKGPIEESDLTDIIPYDLKHVRAACILLVVSLPVGVVSEFLAKIRKGVIQ